MYGIARHFVGALLAVRRDVGEEVIDVQGAADHRTGEYNIKLNNSPRALDELNDLPIKTVNGATIYIRDMAHVRDGYPPQKQRRARGRPSRRADDAF